MHLFESNEEFELTDDQVRMRESVLQLLSEKLPASKIAELDDNSEFPFDAYAALAESGWLGLPHDEQYGGAGGNYMDLAVLIEAIAYHNAQMASAYLTTVVYGGMHLKFGASEQLRASLLPRLIAGQLRLAFCLTEPDTGSDASGIQTKAVAKGDDYVIDGQKVYITCAHVADHLVVAAKTDPAARHKGITLFLVDAKAEGVTIRHLRGLGRRMIHTNEVFFDGVKVPATHVLGEVNGGWKNIMRGLNVERLCLSAAASGNCYRIIESAVDFAQQRKQFGKPITEYQAISHRIADMRSMAEISRVMTYRLASLMDKGVAPNTAAAVTKIFATESNSKCADAGIQIMGGAGLMMSSEMQMYFRDSRVGTIGGGTSEILRNVIAKSMLS
ncbi:acyl-CoA dehydrogenase family protein [Bradyrhizobium sp. CCH5-F6]|jgi:alkylation response protein AidB-like acyl-CoA dehydrogenase|uniref:acyl-CoA dehydrogenase family protein n=2 Tax=unclassified Bradyrhizobium TaxID=2631580 RepID=UPI00076A9533|nr:acyl-CoA dehydrogenase family protein [Bradyrhizobium sp. CCH5-F6]